MSIMPQGFSRWRQFSLRGMLIATTLCCLALGLWSVVVAPYRDQWNAAQAVAAAQGTFQVESADESSWRRWLVARFLGDDRYLKVVAVSLKRAPVDADVIARLSDLSQLRSLDLERTPITDAQLAFLPQLRELKSLSLRFTDVGDPGLARIGELQNLEELHLTGTDVTAALAPHLQRLPKLGTLYIRWTNFTSDDVRELARQLPHCRIYHDGEDADAGGSVKAP